MRVISGIARSVPLITPDGQETRPTSDQTKETLFNILQGYVEGSDFLDLFAGSGQIGVEALSRGANSAVFVEKSETAVKCIKSNVEKTKFTDKSNIIKSDVLSGIRMLEAQKRRFDIIFLDPPYRMELEKAVIEAVDKTDILKEDGIMIIEADKRSDFSYVDGLGFTIIKDKLYKNTRHLFIRKI